MSRRSHRFINSPMLHGINQKSYASMHRDLVIFPFLNHRTKNKEHGFFSPWMLTRMTPPNRYTLWHIDRYRWQVPMAIFSKSCWVSLIKGGVTSWMVHTTPCWVIAWWSWESPIERWWSGSLGGRRMVFFGGTGCFGDFFWGGAFFEKLEEGCS